MTAGKELILRDLRCVYPHLVEPKSFNEGDIRKYQIRLLISKTDSTTVNLVKETVKSFINGTSWTTEQKTESYRKSFSFDSDKHFMRDGDLTDYAEGHFFITLKQKEGFRIPTVYDQKNVPIPIDKIQAEIYGGCWVNTKVNIYQYKHPTGPGIGLALKAVQKVRDDSPLMTDEASPFDALEQATEEFGQF